MIKKALIVSALALASGYATAQYPSEADYEQVLTEIVVMQFETCKMSKILQGNFEQYVQKEGRTPTSRAHLYRRFVTERGRDTMMMVMDTLWATFESEETLQGAVGTSDRQEAVFRACLNRSEEHFIREGILENEGELMDLITKFRLM